jgi:alpha-galactosidase
MVSPQPRWRAGLLHWTVLAVLLTAPRAAADTRVLVAESDAIISHDSATDAWTIGAGSIAVTLALDANQGLVVRQIANPRTGRVLIDSAAPDTMLTLNGQSVALASRGTGLHFEGSSSTTWHGGVHLTFTYRHEASHAAIVRHYAAYPGSPTIETWTTVRPAAGANPLMVSQLVGWQLTVPVGTVRWITGLRGDAPDTPVEDAFSAGHRDLEPGESVTLAASRRSSERFMPFVMIDNGGDEWFGGAQWTGAWQITCSRVDAALTVSLDYPDVTTTIADGDELEMPHSFLGSVSGGPPAVSGALRGFLTTGVRLGRPIVPLVTYNTWYPYGTRIDEPTMLDEIDRTAALGMELFVLDAGWYPGAGTRGFSDFETGLGTWTVDAQRFPDGLRPLADAAHAHGMKFGLWVEPGRVSLDTVGTHGLARPEWLAQQDGANVTPTSGQICYGTRAGRAWVRHQLFALLDAVRPDYLKWDNNAWVNCNRDDHDHGTDDGNFAQVRGLYRLLEDVRERYPTLLIENVADGGSRIDFGILRYSDVAWMDDRTTPAAHVRHNFEGLSAFFPPGYLLSFVLDSASAPLSDSSDPIADIRSRMMGGLGFGYRSPQLRPWLSDLFTQAIADYRRFRDILQNADAVLLGGQAPSATGSEWDAIEALNASTGDALLFAYHEPDAFDRVRVYPRGLQPDVTYAVQSLDRGDLGASKSDTLMTDGIEIVQGSGTQAHILILRRLP